MDETGSESDVLTALGETLHDVETVEFAVVFGSQVSGDTTDTSDLDLAVKFVDDLSANERFYERCRLAGVLQRDDRPFVDVSDVEALPLEVAHDAVSGRLVCGDRRAFEAFEREIEARFADEREDLRTRRQRVIDRIAEEGLRG